MPSPCLAFCPYLPMEEPIEFGDWELGPLAEFEERWADPDFKTQAKAFLAKFVDGAGKPIKHPSLLCRRQGSIDGTSPSTQEIEALTAAIAFAFLDTNPRRCTSLPSQLSQCVVTTDNTEPFFWPIDLASGNVVVTTGIMVKIISHQMSYKDLTIRPPLDLRMPMPIGICAVDAKCLEAVYQTVRQSLSNAGNATADHLRIAIGWFAKAWRNTETVTYEDRVVFLKTAFEALSGTSNSRCTARFLRQLFEAIPHTTSLDSKQLVWSPEERPDHTLTKKNGKPYPDRFTDLEKWFMAFADVRNEIIHKGKSPSPWEYSGSNAAYDGHFVFTAEFLLRAAIKVSLSPYGYPDLWRSDLQNTIAATVNDAWRTNAANGR